MGVAPGARFGSYEVVDLIGVGGMGEVYRARDAKLNRDVALKVLPESFVHDADRVTRFQREAHVLASLNHPNIAAIYGREEAGPIKALVMELVDGPTLADRVASGPLPLDEALVIALQIADALEAAHELGVIHRDLKPANIKVKADGTVKVLDFGLAKVIEPAGARSSDAASHSPTITTPAMTQIGVMLGTAAYMSPEQAKGRLADKRSDVWAFGCVFYEMLTAQRAFAEDDASETLAAVLKSEPDWACLPADVPQPIRTLIQRCLVKDRRQRVADISAAKFVLCQLNNLGLHSATTKVSSPPRSRWQRLALPLAAAAVTALIVSAGAWAMWPHSRSPVVAQFSFTLSEGQMLSSIRQAIAVSPDGTRIAYAANTQIYTRAINELESRAIPGTENASAVGLLHPIFSPDGESIVYFSQGEASTSQTNFVLKRISIAGGAPSTIATLNNMQGASWGTAGILVGQIGGILRISPVSGAPDWIVRVGANERTYGPQLLPDEKTLLFTVVSADELFAAGWDKAQVVVQSLADGTRKVLVNGASDARYLPSGHLVYGAGGTMFAAPFDVKTLSLTRSAVPVIAGVRRATGRSSAGRHFATSDTGTLLYIPGPSTTSAVVSVVLATTGDEPVILKIPDGEYAHPRVSPDGQTIAIARSIGQQSDVCTYDLSGKTQIRRLTFDGNSRFPVWSGDRRVTFQSTREGDRAIYWQAADGTGAAQRLTKPLEGEEHRPESWSRDGAHLLFSVIKDGKFSLWVLRRDDKKAEAVGGVQSAEPFGANFSPDGRWIVYASTPVAGGVLSPNRGVFIKPFPVTSELHQVPKRFLDFHPVWTRDGKGIMYIAGSTRPTVFVPVTTTTSVAFGTPIDLPRGPYPGLLSGDVRGYDVLPDGGFISLAPTTAEASWNSPRSEIRVVLNWFEELKRLAPMK